MLGIEGTHDVTLMAISFAIAWFASYTALDIAERISHNKSWMRAVWLSAAAFSMGSGIWAMHFVAMLAYNSPYIITYDIELTFYSYIVAIIGTGIGFFVVGRNQSYYAILASGIITGLAIALMHYMGMAAMKMPATISYGYLGVGLSILVAIGAATSALWLSFNTTSTRQKLTASFIMGFAISGMHYTGMEACSFVPTDIFDTPTEAGFYQINLALATSIVVGFILLFSLISSIFDRRFAFLAQEESLRLIENERKYRELFRETPLPIHIIDNTGIIQDVSNSWLQLLSYSRQEVLGELVTKYMSDDSTLTYETRLNGFVPSHLNEYQFTTKDGRKVDVLLSSSLRRDDFGAFIGAQEGLVDITNRKVAETALRQKQKMEALGELVGGISHDFNNLLMIISGSLDLMFAKPQDSNKRALAIQDTVKRGQLLTRRLLTFSSQTSDKRSFIDLRLFLPEMKEMLERTLGASIQVNIDVRSDIYLIEVNQDELELTIVNLCVNARDAINGRGYITIQAVNEMLPNEAIQTLRGQFVKISVIDNGMGIDSNNLPRVFDPFFTTKNKEFGSGLGLTQVYGFATVQNGGTVTINSKPGMGTVVNVYLPTVVIHSSDGAILQSVSDRFVDGRGRKVLLVEDDTQVGEIIETLFKQLNFDTIAAHNAA